MTDNIFFKVQKATILVCKTCKVVNPIGPQKRCKHNKLKRKYWETENDYVRHCEFEKKKVLKTIYEQAASKGLIFYLKSCREEDERKRKFELLEKMREESAKKALVQRIKCIHREIRRAFNHINDVVKLKTKKDLSLLEDLIEISDDSYEKLDQEEIFSCTDEEELQLKYVRVRYNARYKIVLARLKDLEEEEIVRKQKMSENNFLDNLVKKDKMLLKLAPILMNRQAFRSIRAPSEKMIVKNHKEDLKTFEKLNMKKCNLTEHFAMWSRDLHEKHNMIRVQRKHILTRIDTYIIPEHGYYERTYHQDYYKDTRGSFIRRVKGYKKFYEGYHVFKMTKEWIYALWIDMKYYTWIRMCKMSSPHGKFHQPCVHPYQEVEIIPHGNKKGKEMCLEWLSQFSKDELWDSVKVYISSGNNSKKSSAYQNTRHESDGEYDKHDFDFYSDYN